MKRISGVYNNPQRHWVGDGFPVHTLFSYDKMGEQLSPFLMLDYAAPMQFQPSTQPRGVGEHPHRGFETVTIVYGGEVEHRDSAGGGGLIGPGDVQWMTAGSGILHDEFHSHAFSQQGGTMEMVQLWVNLPAKDKMTAPGYQSILNQDIPVVALPDAAGQVRVIAGTFDTRTGPARTFSPLSVWDVQLKAGKNARFSLPDGQCLAVVMLDGRVEVNGEQVVGKAQLVVFDRDGEDFTLSAESDAKLLILGGEPLGEPIAGYGPFVMNTDVEIRQAIDDFNRGLFGQMPQ